MPEINGTQIDFEVIVIHQNGRMTTALVPTVHNIDFEDEAFTYISPQGETLLNQNPDLSKQLKMIFESVMLYHGFQMRQATPEEMEAAKKQKLQDQQDATFKEEPTGEETPETTEEGSE